jgi:hypothetical protein
VCTQSIPTPTDGIDTVIPVFTGNYTPLSPEFFPGTVTLDFAHISMCGFLESADLAYDARNIERSTNLEDAMLSLFNASSFDLIPKYKGKAGPPETSWIGALQALVYQVEYTVAFYEGQECIF